MNQNLTRWSQQYVKALEENLKPGSGASLKPALALGRQAVALGLEAPELARIHKRALAVLKLSNKRNAFSRMARTFFAEANIPIREMHHAVRQSDMHLSSMKEKLGQCKEKMASSKRSLQRHGAQHKGTESAFVPIDKCHDQYLEEALAVQRELRQLAHRVLAAQEADRKEISQDLQAEIVQTLVGVHARLLCLKQQNRSNPLGLKNEIASAQRLVAKSAKSIRQFARALDIHKRITTIDLPRYSANV